MNAGFRELIVDGVLLAPILAYAAATLAIVLALRPLLHRLRFRRYVANAPLAELCLYVSIFGLLTLFV